MKHDNKNKSKDKLIQELAELRKSEAMYRSVFENSPLGKSLTGVDGSLKVNEAFCNILGYSLEELKAKKWQEITHPDDIQESTNIVQSLLKGDKSSVSYEKRYISKQGNVVWTTVNTAVKRNAKNEPQYFITTINDITEKKNLETQIHQEKAFVDQILDSLPGLFYQINADGHFVRWNKNFEAVSGFSAEEMAKMSPLDLFEGDDIQHVGENIQKVFTEGEASVEAMLVSKTHERTPFIFSGKQILNNEEPFLVGMGINISDRKAIDDALLKSEERYRTLIQSTPLPLCLVNNSGEIDFINDRFTKVFGYTLTDIPTLDNWWLKAYPDENYRKWVLDTWNNAIEKARKENIDIESIEYDVTCKNGEKRTIIIAGITLPDGFLATFIDVTDRKNAQEETNRFFDLTLDYLCIAGTDGYFKRISPSWTNTFGYTEKEFLTKPFFDFIHPDDIQSTVDAVEQLSEQNPVINFINRYRCKNGSYRWLSWVSTPHNNTLYAAAHDITDRKLAESELKTVLMDLQEKNEKLESFNKLAVGREMRIIELKNKINAMSRDYGLSEPYDLSFVSDNFKPDKEKQ